MKYFEIENNLVNTNLDNIEYIINGNVITVTLNIKYNSAYGFGEKFDVVNQKGNIVEVKVKEVCFNQGKYSYFTFPFMMSADGFGIYVKSKTPVTFNLEEDNKIIISYFMDSTNKFGSIYLYEGTPKDIIKQFKDDTINTKIFPKWVLGAWMSSNRWENDNHIYEQLEELENSKIPHNVMVIERWSDLTTFYNWWGSKTTLITGDKYHNYDDFDFSEGLYKNPKKLFNDIHNKNLHVVLWDLPVFATKDSIEGIDPTQRYLDNEYIIDNKLCILNEDNTPYLIPKPNWFRGSMLPDFTNELCCKYWFNHRKHLFDIGIDGFKCDGGEFIHLENIKDSIGNNGLDLVNHYASTYIKAYSEHLKEDSVVFARSGDEFTPGYAITWAGDQETTWPELKHIMTCLLSSSASGINYWGFDITGFSGQLPTPTLYKRGCQLASLVPIMQWHSDPVINGGWDHSLGWKINDRSPWNLARFHKSSSLLESVKRYFNLHYSLIPYFHNLSIYANKTGIPSIRHLVYEFYDDENVINIDDEFMLGDSLLVCPILEDYIEKKKIYLPKGNWYSLYDGKYYLGNKYYDIDVCDDIMPIFFKENTVLPLNLNNTLILGGQMSNDLSKYDNLVFVYHGDVNYRFEDDLGNDFNINNNDDRLIDIKDLKTIWK